MVFPLLLAAATPNCGDSANQLAATMCFGREAERADTDMNMVWKQVQAAMQRLDRDNQPNSTPNEPSFAQALLTSQRAWLAFRDAECRIESYEGRGGSIQPMVENQCLVEVTRTRTKQLRSLMWER